jgi:hypothetical protein
MSSELKVLVACVRAVVMGESRGDVQASMREEIDGSLLLQLAEAHSVMPLLYAGLQSECPASISQALRNRFELNTRSNLAHTAELLKIVRIFAEHDIAVIALKGPVLAAWGYGDLSMRAFSDLDVLVKPKDVPRVKDVLVESGYRLRTSVHCSSKSALLRSKDGELLFERPGGVTVDVHWQLFPDYFPEAIDVEATWRDLSSIELGGQRIPTLSGENLLLFLAAHGGKHRWECLGWLCDLVVVLRRTTIDWQHLMRRARKAHIQRMLLVALRLANDLLGVELPQEVPDVMKADVRVSHIAGEVACWFMRDVSSDQSPLEACRMNIQLLDRWRDRVRFVSGVLITPGEAEWRQLQLPGFLYRLYYPYRLLRLIGKHA